VVSAEIKKRPGVEEVVVHTGQHFDNNMSDVFFEELAMERPKHQLDIHGGGHGEMTGRMLIKLEEIIKQEKPDVVLVYGDTNSTLAGALAASKLHIPVAHVEAGLRSFNMRMPEEINRILTDRVSSWLFTPTEAASRNLVAEGVSTEKVMGVGDVMYDVALFHGKRVSENGGLLKELGLQAKQYFLATIHRAENTDDVSRLKNILAALNEAANDLLPIVWPIHPRTRITLAREGLTDTLSDKVILIDPVGYLDMVQLEKFAAAVVTDSGGVQKEAFFHGVPCITLRDETEWVELVDGGWNTLVPPGEIASFKEIVRAALARERSAISPYGRGDASTRIVDALEA
jgi:UDP-GlcNAc3NAcA epimerase